MEENKAKYVIYLASIYLIMCSATYLHGYWPQFSIDIFTYIPLLEIIKFAITPSIIFVRLVVIMILAFLIFPTNSKSNSNITKFEFVLFIIFQAHLDHL